jgi:hypothetical protein
MFAARKGKKRLNLHHRGAPWESSTPRAASATAEAAMPPRSRSRRWVRPILGTVTALISESIAEVLEILGRVLESPDGIDLDLAVHRPETVDENSKSTRVRTRAQGILRRGLRTGTPGPAMNAETPRLR